MSTQGLLGQYSSKGKFQGYKFNLRVLELGTLGHIVVTAGDPGTRFHSQPNLWLQLNAVAESDYNRVPGHPLGRGSDMDLFSYRFYDFKFITIKSVRERDHMEPPSRNTRQGDTLALSTLVSGFPLGRRMSGGPVTQDECRRGRWNSEIVPS